LDLASLLPLFYPVCYSHFDREMVCKQLYPARPISGRIMSFLNNPPGECNQKQKGFLSKFCFTFCKKAIRV
jgi:hypothetical protein